MIRINQLKINTEHTQEQLRDKVAELFRIPVKEIKSLEIIRQSIDARKKPEIFYIYTVDAEVANEKKLLQTLQCRKGLKEQIQRAER